MKPGPIGLSAAEKESIWEARAEGLNDSQTARRLRMGRKRVRNYLASCGGIRPRPRRRPDRCLRLSEREEISRGIAAEHPDRRIARVLGRSHTTISREIARNGGRGRYRAHLADRRAWERAQRPKPTKVGSCPELARIVAERLKDDNSPEQISGWLRLAYPDNERMRLSPETIYRSLFVQSRGGLKRELTAHLRTRRFKRRPRGADRSKEGRGKVREMVMISERPAEVADRAVPGHWEGDLLMGTIGNAIATLVERQTRFVQLVALPDGYKAEPVREALAASVLTLPEQLRGSLTWDQGLEMAEHQQFSVDTGVLVFFCDPQSPWQRGSNENTNGLLRQYFPKGKSLKGVGQDHLDEIAAKLNRRPRKTLGFRTPAEKLSEVLDAAADR